MTNKLKCINAILYSKSSILNTILSKVAPPKDIQTHLKTSLFCTLSNGASDKKLS